MAFGKFFLQWLVVVLSLVSVIQCNETSYNYEDEEEVEKQFIFKKERHWKRIDAEAGQITVVPSFRENSKSAPQLHNYEVNFLEMDPNSIMLPQYMDARWYMYIHEGKGRIGWLHTGKLIEQDLKTGQIYFVPEGAPFYVINTDKNQSLIIINLLYNENPTSPDRHHELYYVGGGQNPPTVFSGFRQESLAAGLGMDMEEVENLFQKQERGPIISLGKQQTNDQLLSWPWAPKKHPGSSEEPEKPFNLNTKTPDFVNEYGYYIKADSQSYPPLGRQDLGIGYTRHEGGAMTGPHWSSRSSSVSVVVKGRGRVEIVIPVAEAAGESGRDVKAYRRVEGEVSAGDVFIVPACRPAAELSYSDEGFDVLTFLINTEYSDLIMLTGKNSVMTEIKEIVLAVAMNEKVQVVKKVSKVQKDEVFMKGPKEAEGLSIVPK
eukprot:PITA_21681